MSADHDIRPPGSGSGPASAPAPVSAKGLTVDAGGVASAVWRKSTRSGPMTDNCVEVAFAGEAILVRDSKQPDGPMLVFTTSEWDAFVDGAKDGEFDL